MNKEEKREYNKKYQEDNKDEICQYKKQYYLDNKERITNQRKEYRETHKIQIDKYQKDNKERITKQKKQYRKDNKEKISKQQKQYHESHKIEIHKRQKEYRESQSWYGGSKTNKESAQYLGITVAEKVLSKIFKNVEVMPFGNSGYDFKCNSGYLIDVKSACKRKNQNYWMFRINRNQIADYFLCLAFDNRDDLNPEHIWLIPAKKVRHLTSLAISIVTIDKWLEYELTNKLNDVINCCNIIKSEQI